VFEANKTDTLFLYRAQEIALREALSQWLAALKGNGGAHQDVTALAYGRDSCLVTRVTPDGNLEHPDENSPDPYEVRAFTEKSELRWLRTPATPDAGRAAILSDDSLDMPPVWHREQVPIAGTLCQQYLIWGEGTGRSVPQGWSQVGEARIGALLLPVSDIKQGERVFLRTVEYLCVDQEHGNTFVYDERLVGLGSSNVRK